MLISIDIGGTYLRIAKFNSSEKDLIISKFLVSDNLEENLRLIDTEIELFKPASIAFGIASEVMDGVIYTSNGKKLSCFNNFNPSKYFKIPTFTKEDTYFAALGEASFGNIFTNNFLYINWGSGIGGAKVELDNQVKVLTWISTFKSIEDETKKYDLKILEDKNFKVLIKKFVDFNLKLMRVEGFPNIILSGGVINSRRDLFEEYLKENSLTQIIKISNLGDNQGLLGGYRYLNIPK